ncbi:GNAT family N-acetyltransferase [Acidithiobacillus sp.]|jgi:ribosomal protein S18 acetylase RimI-like enzyme|uniref:GNAT family N-acetyltransferase n=1 Tax=Acidithiobacillus sp. TaxID=1872118 RepID=UPI0025C62430|nr:GNAT family N-acetyltransferase [Acidithiobacillus sp.]MCK9189891.1 GNAT family N-acetyltransferase [Acidithiobacillus sp.]MCK9359521.1 GNAT family N-acetyltransferase [Acidithiobacillus sp.]
MRYREATPDDLPSICTLGEEVNAVHHRAFPDVFAGPGKHDRDAAHWLNSIGKDSAITFVAEEDGKVLGFVNVSMANESHSLLQPMRFGRVGSISITEERRGQGIGPALMKLAQDWVAQHGGSEVRLNVWAFNAHALHLYEELGYEIRSLFLAKRLPSGA